MRSAINLLTLCLLVFACVVAGSAWDEWNHHRDIHTAYWNLKGAAAPEQSIKITFGLKLRNTNRITPLLMQLSDPRSPRYGQYLSQEQVYDLTSPSASSINTVINWIKEGNGKDIKLRNNGGFISAVFSISDATRFFSMDDSSPSFVEFAHKIRNDYTVIRTLDTVYIPATIQREIQTIDGLTNFPYLNVKESQKQVESDDSYVSIFTGDSVAQIEVSLATNQYSNLQVRVTQGNAIQAVNKLYQAQFTVTFTALANYVPLTASVYGLDSSGAYVEIVSYTGELIFPSPWITAEVANLLYGIPPGTRSTNPQNSQSVAEFDLQFYSPADLTSFSTLMGLPQPNVTVVGNNNENFPGGESTLDIEWITAIGVDVPTVFWSVSQGFLLEWAIQVAEDPNPPLVHSISYGEPERFLSAEDLNRMNEEFQLLGARGLTIISTSGDLGSSDGTPICARDVPDFPSSSPWTTSLGATFIAQDTNTPICTGYSVDGLPIVCDATVELPCAVDAGTGFTTGGGFSSFFERPSYQDAAVQNYLNTAFLPPSNYFNASGRAYNDVGALGFNILTYQNGRIRVTGGTSASGPIFAGVVALLNDYQLNAGKDPLGFINPWLYQTSAANVNAFNQVLSGDNKCRESGQACCANGFVAQEGWNPLTGLGTPVFTSLRDALP